MAESNCKQLDFGVESGSNRILKLVKKGFTVERVVQTFRDAKKAGIRTFATIMIGHPTERKEDLEKTLKLIKKIKPNFTLAQYCTPLPGTHLYQWALNKNKIKEDYYKKKDYHFYTENKPLVNLSDVSDEILIKYKKKIDKMTFARNYMSLINAHNLKYFSVMFVYSLKNIEFFKQNISEFFKSRNIDKFIISILYNYQKEVYYKKKSK